jgi:hypothetical protein
MLSWIFEHWWFTKLDEHPYEEWYGVVEETCSDGDVLIHILHASRADLLLNQYIKRFLQS